MLFRLVFACLLSCLAAALPSAWQPARASDETPIVVYKTARGASLSALLAKTRAKGRIRVIVGLDLTMRMEEGLSATERQSQSRRLRTMQDSVVARARIPASTHVIRYETIPYLSTWVTPAELQALYDAGETVSIQEDVPRPPTLADSVPLITADKLWSKGFNGTDQTIAVLDTGVDPDHAMLDGKVVSGACYSTNNGPNVVSLCPGGVTEFIGTSGSRHCSIKGCDHGTHVASIAAGFSSSTSGVAFHATVASLQIFTRHNSDSDCGGAGKAPCVLTFSSDQIKALERVFALRTNFRFAAVNMSIGGGKFGAVCDSSDPALTAVIEKLRAAGIVTVIASGNDGFDGFISAPGCIAAAITVGSSTKTDRVSSFSNHASLVDVLAPGSDISAAKAGQLTGLVSKNGTSMATPHVAGAFALLRHMNNNFTVNDMARALICTGTLLRRTGNAVFRPRIRLINAWRMLKEGGDANLVWRFSTNAQGAEWQQLLGNWAVGGDQYFLSRFTDKSEWNMAFAPSCRDRLTLTARMKRVDQMPDRTFFWNSGVMLRAKYDTTKKIISGYWFGYNAYDDDPETAGKGQAIVMRFDDKDLLGTGGFTELCVVDNATVFPQNYNTIKVVANESNYDYFLNNKLICSFTDTRYVTGAIGVSAGGPIPFSGTQRLDVEQVSVETTAVTRIAPQDYTVHPSQFAPQEPSRLARSAGVAAPARSR